MELLQHTRNIMERKEEQRSSIRKRNLVVLVHGFLLQNGYTQAAESLKNETNVKLDQYSVCDNVDLEIVLQEYETFQYVKFRHYPSIVKASSFDENRGPNASIIKKPTCIAKTRPVAKVSCVPACTLSEKDPIYLQDILQKQKMEQETSARQSEKSIPTLSQESSSFSIEGLAFGNHSSDKMNIPLKSVKIGRTLLKSLPPLTSSSFNHEWRQLADIISKDIYLENPNVSWESIVGLDNAKRIIKEAIVYPVRHPSLFCGLLAPWKGLLLFGPPGNGKTLLAKALATECKTTFFNISASTIVSKWRGDSEKLIRVMFELARQSAPSTIFLDEVDALMCTRDTAGNSEHEASRRMKTELLVQMDGLANTDELVFVLAASNMPWDLDPALLRRLEKRVVVPLPETEAREAMFQKFLPKRSDEALADGQLTVGDIDYEHLAERTVGYSGADIKLVCREAAMSSIRGVLEALEPNTETADIAKLMHPIETRIIEAAIESTKPSARHLCEKYMRWQREFGSV